MPIYIKHLGGLQNVARTPTNKFRLHANIIYRPTFFVTNRRQQAHVLVYYTRIHQPLGGLQYIKMAWPGMKSCDHGKHLSERDTQAVVVVPFFAVFRTSIYSIASYSIWQQRSWSFFISVSFFESASLLVFCFQQLLGLHLGGRKISQPREKRPNPTFYSSCCHLTIWMNSKASDSSVTFCIALN